MDHVSFSQLSMWLRCQRQYYLRHVCGLIRPPGIAVPAGTGLHIAAATGMRHKAQTGSDLKPEKARDAAVAGFDGRLEDTGVSLTREEQGRGRKVVIGNARDRAARFGQFWADEVQPAYWPASEAAVEQAFSFGLNGDLDFVGIIDLIDHYGNIVDWKTASRSPSSDAATTSLQLASYGLAFHREHKRPAVSLRTETLVDLKLGIARKFSFCRPSQAAYQAVLTRISHMLRAVKAGSFPGCDPSNWYCSPQYCGYAGRECTLCMRT